MSGDDPSANSPRTSLLRQRPGTLWLVLAGLLYGGGATFLLLEARPTGARWIAVVGLVGISWWSTAHLLAALNRAIERATHRADRPAPPTARATRRLAWPFLVAFLGTPLLVGAWLRLDPPVDLLGNNERLFLAPVLALLIVDVARRFDWHRGITILVTLFVLSGMFGGSQQADWPTELVAAAGPAELATSLRDDRPIALAAARHERGAPIAPIPTRPGMRCQRIEVRDQRRTLLGFPAGRTEITTDTCWLADGTPFAVRVIASTDAGDTEVNPNAVQVVAPDQFALGRGMANPIDAAPDAPRGRRSPSYSVKPFEDDGRVRIDNDGPRPVLARVGRRGRQVDLAIGWLRIDPFKRTSSAVTAPRRLGAAERIVDLAESPERNEALDVFTVRGYFLGGPDPEFVRLRPRGTGILAATSSSTGMNPVAGGQLRERVVLHGGR